MRWVLLWLLLGALAPRHGTAQGEHDIWYFGYWAGLDFSNGAPTPLLNSAMQVSEGCSVRSDANGNLELYTDGVNVWNRFHQLMPNGFGLFGNANSSQNAIILPTPGSDSLYYIFTAVNNIQPEGVCYSVVDLTLDGGNGDVTTKNVQLVTPACEKLTAVQHANDIDWWILARSPNQPEFYSFLLTAAGVQAGYVSSLVGSLSSQAIFGCMKPDQSGDRLVSANQTSTTGYIEVFDFDRLTGVLSNPMMLSGPNIGRVYATEFSPSGRYLYASEAAVGAWSKLHQFDMLAGSQSDIIASDYVLDTWWGGAIRSGPDGKIYRAQKSRDSLGVVNEPDMPGASCNYSRNGQSLGGQECNWGLPATFASKNHVTGYGVLGQRSRFRVHPNPCDGFTTIEANDDLNAHEIIIRSISGQLLFRTNWPERKRTATLDLGAFVQGIYVLELSGPTGRSSHRVIKN